MLSIKFFMWNFLKTIYSALGKVAPILKFKFEQIWKGTLTKNIRNGFERILANFNYKKYFLEHIF